MGSVLLDRLRLFGFILLVCAVIWTAPSPVRAQTSAVPERPDAQAVQATPETSAQIWRNLEPGVELAIFTPNASAFRPANIVVARFDPELVDFVLLNASENGPAVSLTGWADSANLIAATNASMYLPDASTSTGYMRNGSHVNNPRIASRFGAFFVAGLKPGATGLPRAGVLDRNADPWEERLDAYDIVVQNYRMISADGRMLWSPGGPEYAVAAVAQDPAGHILFIHCREPMTGADFCQLLLTLPLDLRVVMYVEGGPQAGLLLRAGDVHEVWMGRHVADFLTSGNKSAPLPNVIGVRRRLPAHNSPNTPGTP